VSTRDWDWFSYCMCVAHTHEPNPYHALCSH